MQIFKAESNIYLVHEVKSWISFLAFLSVVALCCRLFFGPLDRLYIYFFVAIFMKIFDGLTGFHVKQVRIDGATNEVVFHLKNIISGKKTLACNLDQVRTELKKHGFLTRITGSPLTLKVYVSEKLSFRIDSRYGLSEESLEAMHLALGARPVAVVGE